MNSGDMGIVHMEFENKIGFRGSRHPSFLPPVGGNYWNTVKIECPIT